MPRKYVPVKPKNLKYIFCGPIKGTTPFHIKGLDEAFKKYQRYQPHVE